jgi:hypothetical protein
MEEDIGTDLERYSAVGVATACGLFGREGNLIPDPVIIFGFTLSTPVLVLTQPPIHWVRECFPEVQVTGA